MGTDAEPGSMLVTVGGAVLHPGVHEIEIGTRIGDVLALSGGPVDGVAGVLVGGYFGTWLRDGRPSRGPLLRGWAPTGRGVGRSRNHRRAATHACGLQETARIARYLSRESAGQCGPCVFGLRALADAALALAGGRHAIEALQDMRDLPGEIEGRGACAHPDGAARLARSAIDAFQAEVQLHLQGRCSAPHGAPVVLVPASTGEWR